MELEVSGVGKCGKQKLSHVKGSIIMMLRGVAIKFVSMKGAHHRTVGKFVTVKASNFNKSQQFSTNGLQQVQYQSLRNHRFQ
jgi:hypothetical protein